MDEIILEDHPNEDSRVFDLFLKKHKEYPHLIVERDQWLSVRRLYITGAANCSEAISIASNLQNTEDPVWTVSERFISDNLANKNLAIVCLDRSAEQGFFLPSSFILSKYKDWRLNLKKKVYQVRASELTDAPYFRTFQEYYNLSTS